MTKTLPGLFHRVHLCHTKKLTPSMPLRARTLTKVTTSRRETEPFLKEYFKCFTGWTPLRVSHMLQESAATQQSLSSLSALNLSNPRGITYETNKIPVLTLGPEAPADRVTALKCLGT